MMMQQPPHLSSFDLAEPACEDLAFDSIPYDVELKAAIEEALASVKRGESIPFEEFEKEIDSWFSK
ncbi:MAG: hypothetical protein FJ390_00375 [Verrucomicrobia bacterium]|nr:hypothetical protein [Verrucomicrobiota bacterium]